MENKQEQSYENHRRLYPLQHFVLMPLGLVTFLAAIGFAIADAVSGELDWKTVVLFSLVLQSVITGILTRRNSLVVQDRVIRAEEGLRHLALTGKPLSGKLTIRQIIALRFASDEEFPQLAAQAAESGLSPADIKKSVKQWRADHHRV
ncbi:DUF6526 family protein [Paenibacillus oceani]|uniref:Uncharacterized protein n=1 Tax=Paenibacillus oceani TaxID=2772510 RepID=A0A927GZ38_9BACL|nr:DUF6526 family protein [Paenibacillus oceani]MBD2861843.1 hypothetical protein [Paenibacillus oceani]